MVLAWNLLLMSGKLVSLYGFGMEFVVNIWEIGKGYALLLFYVTNLHQLLTISIYFVVCGDFLLTDFQYFPYCVHVHLECVRPVC